MKSRKSARILTGAGAAVAALLVAAILSLLGMRLYYLDRVLPGIYAGNIDLSGLTREETAAILGESFTYPDTGILIIIDQEEMRTAAPVELGVVMDIAAMSEQALAFGRTGSLFQRIDDQLTAWFQGSEIAPIVLWDEWIATSYLNDLASQINQPMIEATLALDGLNVISVPGQIGRELDLDAAMEAIRIPVSTLHDGEVILPVNEVEPLIADTTEPAARVRVMLSEPFTLEADGAGPWVFQPHDIADYIEFAFMSDDEGAAYEVGVDVEAMTAFLTPLAPTLERQAENARFIFNDDTHELDLLQPAIIARILNIPASINAMNAALNSGAHAVELAFDTDAPEINDSATAEDLGISEAVSVVSTYFSGSSRERIQNITTAASAFHGLLIPPGGTLSMADILGDISLDNGYAEALIIFGDRTILGVGGGVCQVSTTLFRAAFFGGFPIEERHSHAYRVGYYEQGPGSPGPGLDATVFVPSVDFRFTNDSPYWLLLETYIYGNQLLWKFYSTSDGRTVEWSRTISNEVEAPEPLYRENDALQEGEIEQVDYEADGMNVIVYRTVLRSGETLHQDTFRTNYRPWRAIYEYGPGTDLPAGAQTE
ncbi:MAG: VanW family protein [Anaerolineales bacterium]|nr:VanW family protein [Anaerolineales bacterium]